MTAAEHIGQQPSASQMAHVSFANLNIDHENYAVPPRSKNALIYTLNLKTRLHQVFR